MSGGVTVSATNAEAELRPAKLPEAGSLRELLAVAIPLVLSSGSITLMITIDRLFLTWYSTDALAASLPAGALHWTMLAAMVGTITYVNTFVAQYDGAGQRDRVVTSVWQGIQIAIAGGVLFIALVPLAPFIFALGGHEAHVQQLETQFFSVLCLGAVPMLLSMALASFYTGRGKTRVVMYVNFLLAATNIALDPFLIFGIWPFPRLGIAGAGLATDTAYSVAVLAYLVLSRRGDAVSWGFWTQPRRDAALLRRLIRYGLPTGLQMTVEVAAFSVFLVLIGRLGTDDLAASNLAFNINMLSFVPMIGVGTAVMTLVGKRIGEGRPELAERTTWLAVKATASYMLFFGFLFITFPELILWPFTGAGHSQLAGLREQVVVLLWFVAFYTFFDGLQIVFADAIRGAGDTRFPFYYTLVTAWGLMVAPTYFFVSTGRGGLYACWCCCSFYICLLGTTLLLRFRQGKWKTMNVIGKGAPQADEEPCEVAVDAPLESRGIPSLEETGAGR